MRRVAIALSILASIGLAGFVADEVQTSRQQADWLAARAQRLSFELQPGPSQAIRYAGNGPYDQRLGYHQLPQLIERLEPLGYSVTAQARMSPALLALRDEGYFAPYR